MLSWPLPRPSAKGVKSGDARTFGFFFCGANDAAGTKESISQRPWVCLKTAVIASGPSGSFCVGWRSRSMLISRGNE